MSDPVVLRPGEGLPLRARGARLLFKALGADSGGAFSLMERVLPPGGRPPPPHTHPAASEAFYLLDGTLEFLLDAERTTVDAGGFVLVPGTVAHSFRNRADRDARVLILHTPALDGYFRDLHELWSRPDPPGTTQEQELMVRHGLVPAGGWPPEPAVEPPV